MILLIQRTSTPISSSLADLVPAGLLLSFLPDSKTIRTLTPRSTAASSAAEIAESLKLYMAISTEVVAPLMASTTFVRWLFS